MRQKVTVSEYFETWTPEDLELGDTDDRGEHDTNDFETVEEAAEHLKNGGFKEPSSSSFYSSIYYSSFNEDQDLYTGARTVYTACLKGFTPEQELEIYKILTRKVA